MPQRNGQFVPTLWNGPRPTMAGQGAAFMAPVTHGDAAHIFKQQPLPGADGYALKPTSPAMAYSLQGPGFIVQDNGANKALSGPQVHFEKAPIITGLQGQVYGGAYGQGLIDMNAYYMGSAT